MKNKHHIFSLAEIRIRLLEIVGKPKTEEEKQLLREKAKRIYTGMPVFKLKRGRHAALHSRLRKQQRLATLLRKRNFDRSLYHAIIHMFEQSPEK